MSKKKNSILNTEENIVKDTNDETNAKQKAAVAQEEPKEKVAVTVKPKKISSNSKEKVNETSNKVTIVDEETTVVSEEIIENTDSKDINNLDNIQDIPLDQNTNTSSDTINYKVDNSLNNTQKKSKKGPIILIVSIAIIVILLLAFSTVFALFTKNSNTIIKGISIFGIDVSELSKEDAYNKVKELVDSKVNTDLVFQHSEQSYSFMPNQFDASFDFDKSINEAYMIGRTGNIFENNFKILSCLTTNYNIDPNFIYSEEKLNALITELEARFEDGVVQPSYTIEDNELIISKGKDGYTIEKESFKNEIIRIVTHQEENTNMINVPIQIGKCNQLNLEEVYKEIYKEAVDAKFTTEPFTVYPSTNGLDFKVSMEEAQNLLNAEGEECIIPLKVTYPKTTTNQIGEEAFPNQLGTYSTTYSTKNGNRSTNIGLATKKINDIVLMPGEVFSYNQIVGKRTIQDGYKTAAVYANGEVTEGIGGGICQVSTTLYNAVLLSNLEIVERRNHTFQPGYVPPGRDATVSWGGPDFKFKNSRNYPIKIIATTSGGKISIKILGLHEETEYEVEIVSSRTGTVAFNTTYVNDATLAKGTTKVIQKGSNGSKAVSYRVLKLNGQEISRTLLGRDTYSPHNQVIARGTK